MGDEARALVRANVDSLGLGGVTKLFRRDARKLGAAPPGSGFSLAFLDPPYGQNLAAPALASLTAGGWLTPGALIIVEENAHVELTLPPGLSLIESRRYDDTQLVFLERDEEKC
jgi:16S rRNA (guanine966-N2)-methyltransferase